MRQLWLWGLGLFVIVGMTSLGGLVRASDDDEPAPPRKAGYGRGGGLWERWFASNEKPAPVKPKKDADKDQKPKVEKPATDGPAAIRLREEAALMRRLEVCDKLKNLAGRTNDDEMLRRAEELDQRAWTLFRQRTARLPGNKLGLDSDEEILDRHLGGKTAAVDNGDSLKTSSAKAKDRSAQAAAREVKP